MNSDDEQELALKSRQSPDHPFDTRPDGTIVVQPLIGWHTAPAQGIAIIAKFLYATSEENLPRVMSGQAEPKALQLIITPDQADELAERLHQLASHIRSQTTPPKSSQN
ncbi:hypothetical protein [Paracoccus yeei]|uniref:Uncharacterized protein n=1 Tax=Paracoccus yeei TaxID=147645 RepID=A0A5P2QRQ9_9RHOB|nr:hypothetical protein [Paracoccus yeei]QEU08751.1 hypothetical protein FOB51_12535 [Paracoccus yeei]